MNTQYIDEIIRVFFATYVNTDKDDLILFCCKDIIDRIVEAISNAPCSVEEKVEKVKMDLKDQILKYLTTYKKDEVNIGLSCLKAYFKVLISDTGNEKDNFEFSMRLEEVLNLLLIENSVEFHGGNSIINGSKNMQISFRLAYHYCVLCDNIEHYLIQKEKYNSLLENDLMLIFKEGGFYSEQYSEYMDSFLFMNLYEMPEDSVIQTEAIQDRMHREKLTMEDIRCLQEGAVKEYLGFSFEELRSFGDYMRNHQNNAVYFFMRKTDFIEKIEKEYGFGTAAERIIEYFSMNFELINHVEKVNKIRLLELKSVLEIEDSILIYPLEFSYNWNCIEKFALRKHFFEYLAVHLEDSQKEEFEKRLDKYVDKMSSFLAYVLLDKFCANGYTVPKCGNEPIAEIKSINKVMEDKKHINILRDERGTIGDIDVLAADENKKEIYNIEIKYYKPLANVEEMRSKSKVDEREKNIISPLRREKALYDNIEEVLHFLGLDPCEAGKYKVRTIFVTPRPDYWLKEKASGIEYYQWVEIFDGIEKKSL